MSSGRPNPIPQRFRHVSSQGCALDRRRLNLPQDKTPKDIPLKVERVETIESLLASDPDRPKRKLYRLSGNPQSWTYQAYMLSAQWEQKRLKIFSQRGRSCEDCGETRGEIHVHHLNYKRLGAELPEDLRVLCRTCHKKRHSRNTILPPKANKKRLSAAALASFSQVGEGGHPGTRDSLNAQAEPLSDTAKKE